MASAALAQWQGPSRAALDEVADALALATTSRLLTEQLTHAYVALLVAHFQGFCRALHSEAARAIARTVPHPSLAMVVESALALQRNLDRGNPSSRALGEDFGRFGFVFWAAVHAHDQANASCQRQLDQLIAWRNAIVDADLEAKFARGSLHPDQVTPSLCAVWRRALDQLAVSFDAAIAAQRKSLDHGRPT